MKISKKLYNRNVIEQLFVLGERTLYACNFPILLQVVLLEQGYRVDLKINRKTING